MQAGVGRPRLLLLRHGQGMLGTDDYDRLSQAGQRQSELMGERVRAELGPGWLTWSGALRRHRQTLGRLNAPGVVFIDPALNEYRVDELIRHAIEQAEFLGLVPPDAQAMADPQAYLQTFLRWFPQVLEHWQSAQLNDPVNGSWALFRSRVLRSVRQWQAALEGGHDVAVVTSAGVISTLVSELLGRPLTWQRELNVSLYNASVTELRLTRSGRWQSGALNCVGHLEESSLHTLA